MFASSPSSNRSHRKGLVSFKEPCCSTMHTSSGCCESPGEEKDCSLWLQWADKQTERKRRPLRKLSKTWKESQHQQDFLIDHRVDAEVQEFMIIPEASEEQHDWPQEASLSLLSGDSSPGPMGGDKAARRTRKRFSGKYLQADVIATMKAYIRDGFRESICYKAPKVPKQVSAPTGSRTPNRRKNQRDQTKSPSVGQDHSSKQTLQSVEESIPCLLDMPSSLITEQKAILSQIQKECMERMNSSLAEWPAKEMLSTSTESSTEEKKKTGRWNDTNNDLKLEFLPATSRSHFRHIGQHQQGTSKSSVRKNETPQITSLQEQQESSETQDRTVQVDGRSIKVLSASTVHDAMNRGEETVSVSCVSCQTDLVTTAATAMVYCPVCGTLATLGMLLGNHP